jgi:hypothetical protein
MTTNVFVGPDGRAYAEHKPDEGGFLSYFDGCSWLITFPINQGLERSYVFLGETLPTSASQWKIRLVNTHSPFPAFIESC